MQRRTYELSDWRDIYKDKPVLVVGRGYSRRELFFDNLIPEFKANGLIIGVNHTVTVNSIWRKYLDIVCFSDNQIPRDLKEDLNSFPGTIWAIRANEEVRPIKNIDHLSYADGEMSGYGFEPEKDVIWTNHTCSFVALNLMYIAGCNPIYLAGVDLRLPPTGSNIYDDNFGHRIDGKQYQKLLDAQRPGFELAAIKAKQDGREIYRTSSFSTLDCFEVRKLSCEV